MTTSHLCQLARDWNGEMPAGGIMYEHKHNGWRCLFFQGRDGVSRLWSRNGIPLDGAEHVLKRLRRMEEVAGEPLFLDGEVVVDGSLAATKAWFERGWKRGGDAGVLHLFDGMPYSEWRAGGTERPLKDRKTRLADLFAASEPAGDGWTWEEGSRGAGPPVAVQMVEGGWASDFDHVVREAHGVWQAGGEGLMLKDASAPYQRRRCDAWLKVKRENWAKWTRMAVAA